MKKPLTIIASIAIFFSFFLPWISSGLGSISAFKGIKFMIEASGHLNQMPDDFRFYLPLLLIALPICSIIIIINEFSANSKKANTKNSIIVIAIVVALVIIGLIYLVTKAEKCEILNLTGSGFWVSLISAIVLLGTFMEDDIQVKQTARTTPTTEVNVQSQTNEIALLNELKNKGVLTNEEYDKIINIINDNNKNAELNFKLKEKTEIIEKQTNIIKDLLNKQSDNENKSQKGIDKQKQQKGNFYNSVFFHKNKKLIIGIFAFFTILIFAFYLLTFNVSKEILNTFAVVDEGLIKTNRNFKDKNDYMYGALASAKAIDPKAGPYYEAAIKVKKLCFDMDNYITQIKDTLIMVVEKNNRPDTVTVKQIENKENYRISTNILLGNKGDGSEGKARKLRNRLDVLRNDLLNIIKDPKIKIFDLDKTIKDLGDLGIDTKDPSGRFFKPKESYWETSKFYHTPLAGSITILSQIQNQIKNAEATIVNLLLSSISAADFKFDTIVPRVIPKSTYIVSGDKYEAEFFIAAYSTTDNPIIYIGQGYDSIKGALTGKIESIPVTRGVGKYKILANSLGVQKYCAIIKIKNPVTGVYKSFPIKVNGKTDIEYFVVKP